MKNIKGKLVTDEVDSAAGLNEFHTSLFTGVRKLKKKKKRGEKIKKRKVASPGLRDILLEGN